MIYRYTEPQLMVWHGTGGHFTCNIVYNGAPAVCHLTQAQSAWKFVIYDAMGKYIVQYKFRDVSLHEAQTKAEYIVNMEP
jgi:hypothetical protein